MLMPLLLSLTLILAGLLFGLGLALLARAESERSSIDRRLDRIAAETQRR